MSDQSTSNKKPNQLINEKSPYLLQHAYNPVDWYAWNKEAFEKARKENKPIFLSIGYSTCHWCHVMEKESFEDQEVAKLMNQNFVSIKVDREERPDIDSIYMRICQMMTGSGGWPLTIIMTPDRKPFLAATYLPKESRHGSAGMMEIIPQIKDLWEYQQGKIQLISDQITTSLKESSTNLPGSKLDHSILHTTYEQLSQMFDEEYGGFGKTPKFPAPQNLMFLLRYWKRTGDKRALHMVEKTLQAMQWGGIYDHIGFGFHRYSTDSKWLVPHFEKMLYDQAMLAMAYIEAYQATGKETFGKTAREILTYVFRDMTSSEGGFYSAEDADSEGVEGKFYVWSIDEIKQLTSSKEADVIINIFNLEGKGNYLEESTKRKTGTNILHRTLSLSEVSLRLKIPVNEIQKLLESAKKKLFTAREKRARPFKDDKILTDWNGLIIAALAKAAQALDESIYDETAMKAANFILEKMRDPSGKLYHRYREGEVAVDGFLDDYAFLIWGLIELYESTFEVSYLKAAIEINDYLLKHFWGEKNGGFYFTSDETEQLIGRRKDIYDSATPSGNSVAMLNLIRLGRITAQPELEKKAAQIGSTFSEKALQAPTACTQLMSALDFALDTSLEIVIVGHLSAADTESMLQTVKHTFLPNKILLFRPADQEPPEITQYAPYIIDLKGIDNKATVYICQNYQCQLPTTDHQKMLELLKTFYK
jgi:uncharacterized protein YyaL (SSP411 family)